MTSIVKTPGAADFLALVPQLAGFVPRNSIVLVAFTGNRTCGALRFDLPPAGDSKFHRRIATSAVGMLSKLREADGVVPVLYTDEVLDTESHHAAFITAVISRARFSGFVVRDALCVASDGWASYLDPHGARRRSLAEIEGSTALAEAGLEPAGELLAEAGMPDRDLLRCERVGRLYADFPSGLAAGSGCLARWMPLLADLPLLMELVLHLDPEGLDDEVVAMLAFCLQSPAIRDAVMLQWAFDLATGEMVLESNERASSGRDAAAAASIMIGEGSRPDPDRIDRALLLLKQLVVLAPASARPPLLSMLAWLNWALGRSSVAGVFVARALEDDPGYGLAELLGTILANGMLPEWAFTSAERDKAHSRPTGTGGEPRSRGTSVWPPPAGAPTPPAGTDHGAVNTTLPST